MAMRFSLKRKLLDGSLLDKVDALFWQIAEMQEVENPTLNKKKNKEKNNTSKAFKWIGQNSDAQLKFLHKELIKNKFIASDTPIDSFNSAYSGNEILKPLNIKWIAKGKNKIVSKSALFHFIDLLAKNSFIDIKETLNNGDLYSKLANIFSDDKGIPLKNLKQTNAQRTQRPIEGDMLNNIILSIPK
ncbi:MAG: hypothetical protein WBM13_02805 [Bacteroidia bacterium]